MSLCSGGPPGPAAVVMLVAPAAIAVMAAGAFAAGRLTAGRHLGAGASSVAGAVFAWLLVAPLLATLSGASEAFGAGMLRMGIWASLGGAALMLMALARPTAMARVAAVVACLAAFLLLAGGGAAVALAAAPGC